MSISTEQLRQIRQTYETLRRTQEYRGRRTRKVFHEKTTLEEIEHQAQGLTADVDGFRVELLINFPAEGEGEAKWREYGGTLLRLFAALAKRAAPPALEMRLEYAEKKLGCLVSSQVSVGEGKDEAVKNVLKVLRLLLYPDCSRALHLTL